TARQCRVCSGGPKGRGHIVYHGRPGTFSDVVAARALQGFPKGKEKWRWEIWPFRSRYRGRATDTGRVAMRLRHATASQLISSDKRVWRLSLYRGCGVG